MRGSRSWGKEGSTLYENGMTLASWPVEKIPYINKTENHKKCVTFHLTSMWVSYQVSSPQDTSSLPLILTLQQKDTCMYIHSGVYNTNQNTFVQPPIV